MNYDPARTARLIAELPDQPFCAAIGEQLAACEAERARLEKENQNLRREGKIRKNLDRVAEKNREAHSMNYITASASAVAESDHAMLRRGFRDATRAAIDQVRGSAL